MATINQLTGGSFQDAEGSSLSYGYLIMQLNQDGQVNGDEQICAGDKIKINLDDEGNVVTSPAQSVWPNDVILPANTFYTVSAYSAVGQLVWGPNAQQVLSTPSPYDIGVWVPSQLPYWNIGTTNPYDVVVSIPGQPQNVTLIIEAFTRTVVFPPNFMGSQGVVGTPPASAQTWALNHNRTEFGQVEISTSGVVTFSLTTGTTFLASDWLSVTIPTTDATLADVAFTLAGSR